MYVGYEVRGQRSFLTHTLKADVVVVKARAAVAGVGGEEIGTLSILTYFRSKHFTLVHV